MLLRVAESLSGDADEQLVRIAASVMNAFGITTSGLVELTGSRCTVASAAPLKTDEDPSMARLGSLVRQNAGVSLGEPVAVSPASVQPARAIVLTPADTGPLDKSNVRSADLAASLAGTAVRTGDTVRVILHGSRPLYFQVQSTAPDSSVLINQRTKIAIAEREVPSGRERVSYEDIGGLDDELKRLREVVELPFRSPEIFERLGIEAPKGLLLHGPLEIHSNGLRLCEDVDLVRLATLTDGAVGADLAALCRSAVMNALHRMADNPRPRARSEGPLLTMSDFERAMETTNATVSKERAVTNEDFGTGVVAGSSIPEKTRRRNGPDS